MHFGTDDLDTLLFQKYDGNNLRFFSKSKITIVNLTDEYK